MKKKIAVVGAGTMGVGITLDLASNGYTVILKDVDEQALVQARSALRTDLRGLKMLKKDLKVSATTELLELVTFTTTYQGFEDVDIVIENVTEQWDVKKKVYQELHAACGPEVIYMVNTSCIPITGIAALTPRPDLVVGMHFMNPVPLKRTLEMIRGFYTSESTLATARDFLRTLDKTAIVVQDSAGFVSNRLSHLFMNEAAFLVMEQVASPKDIDAIFKDGYGHTMGPLETADLIGLDTVVDSLQVLYDHYQDSKYRCCPLLRKMVAAGQLGRKSGQGFFQYD